MTKRVFKKKGRGGRHSRLTLLERYEAALEIQKQEALQRKERRKEEKRRAKKEAKKAQREVRREALLKDLQKQREKRLQRKQRFETKRALRNTPEGKMRKLLNVMQPLDKQMPMASKARPAAALGVLSDDSDEDVGSQEKADGSKCGEREAAVSKPTKRRRVAEAEAEDSRTASSDEASEAAEEAEKEETDSLTTLSAPFILEDFGIRQSAKRLREEFLGEEEIAPFDFSSTFFEEVEGEALQARTVFCNRCKDAAGGARVKGRHDFGSRRTEDKLSVSSSSHVEAFVEAVAGTAFCPVARSLNASDLSSESEASLFRLVALSVPQFAPFSVKLSTKVPRVPRQLLRLDSAAVEAKEEEMKRRKVQVPNTPDQEGGVSPASQTFLEAVVRRGVPDDVFQVFNEGALDEISSAFAVDLYGAPVSVSRGIKKCLEDLDAADPRSSTDFPPLRGALKTNSILGSLHHWLKSYADVYFPHQNAFTSSAVRVVLAGHALGHALKMRARESSTSKLRILLRDAKPHQKQSLLLRLSRGASLRELQVHRAAQVEEEEEKARLRRSPQQLKEQLTQTPASDSPSSPGAEVPSEPLSQEAPSCKAETETESLGLVGDSSLRGKDDVESSPSFLTEEETAAWIDKLQGDGGYTRPRVLVLLPWRSAAKAFLDAMFQMLPSGVAVLQRDRFEKEFSLSEEEASRQEASFIKAKRPRDFKLTFRGSTDDDFKLGIKLARKSIALFEAFQTSDIIVASPLALRTLVGAAGESGGRSEFLSSLEVILVDRADIIVQQNWQLFKEVLEVGRSVRQEYRQLACNKTPESYTDFDIGRLRPSMAAALGCTDRQLVVCSSGRNAKFASLFETHSSNFRGRLELFVPSLASACMPLDVDINSEDFDARHLAWKVEEGTLKGTTKCSSESPPRGLVPASKQCAQAGVQQLFYKVNCSDFTKIERALLTHFVENVLPTLEGDFGSAVVVVPSYLEYCRRYRLLGAKRIIFVGPPTSPEVYVHLLTQSFPEASQKTSAGDATPRVDGASLCFFTEFNLQQLEQILPLHQVLQLLKAPCGRVVSVR